MSAGRRVVIIGVSSHWGAELARRLERDPGDRLHRRDRQPAAPAELERTEFIEADIRSPVLSRLLPATEADTVVHCGILWYPEPGRPARALHDINVIGTLQLLAACERHRALRARDRPRLGGDLRLRGRRRRRSSPRTWPGRSRCAPAFSATSPSSRSTSRTSPAATRGSICCMLRFQPEIGPGLDSPLVRYLSLPVVPIQLGFDPRLQLAPRRRRDRGARGRRPRTRCAAPVNVAPSGSISLSRVLRLVAPPVAADPASAVRARAGAARRAGSAPAALYGDGVRLLRFGRGVDNRRLRDEIGYEPRFDAVAAIRGLRRRRSAGAGSGRRLHPGGLAARLGGAGPMSADGGRRRAAGAGGDRRLPARHAGRGRGRPRPAEPRPSAPPIALPGACATAIEPMRPTAARRVPRGRVGLRRGVRRGGLPALRVPLRASGGGCEADGVRNVPAHGRALLVANHAGSLFPFDASMMTDGDHEGAPAAALAAVHGPRLGVRAAVPVGVHAPGRRRPGEPAQRDAAARAGRAGDGLPRGRQGNRQAVLGALPPAALRPRRIRRGRAADRRADRPGRGRRLGGDLPEARRQPGRSRGRSGAPFVPITPTFPWLGPLGLVPLPSRWRIEFCEPIDVSRPRPRGRRRSPASCSISPSRSGRRSRRSSTRTWSSGARLSCEAAAKSSRVPSACERIEANRLASAMRRRGCDDGDAVTSPTRVHDALGAGAGPSCARLLDASLDRGRRRRSGRAAAPGHRPADAVRVHRHRRWSSTSPPRSGDQQPRVVVRGRPGLEAEARAADGLARSPTATSRAARASRSRSPTREVRLRGRLAGRAALPARRAAALGLVPPGGRGRLPGARGRGLIAPALRVVRSG